MYSVLINVCKVRNTGEFHSCTHVRNRMGTRTSGREGKVRNTGELHSCTHIRNRMGTRTSEMEGKGR